MNGEGNGDLWGEVHTVVEVLGCRYEKIGRMGGV